MWFALCSRRLCRAVLRLPKKLKMTTVISNWEILRSLTCNNSLVYVQEHLEGGTLGEIGEGT